MAPSKEAANKYNSSGNYSKLYINSKGPAFLAIDPVMWGGVSPENILNNELILMAETILFLEGSGTIASIQPQSNPANRSSELRKARGRQWLGNFQNTKLPLRPDFETIRLLKTSVAERRSYLDAPLCQCVSRLLEPADIFRTPRLFDMLPLWTKANDEEIANMPTNIIRVILALQGAAALFIASQAYLSPYALADQLGYSLIGNLGVSSFRADIGGFFVMMGLFMLLAAWRAERHYTLPPLVLGGAAISARLATVVETGFVPEYTQPISVEAVAVVTLLIAFALFDRR